MIRLTKLNRATLAINAELIKCVENSPDTVITLTTGDKILVREDIDEVIAKIIEYRKAVLGGRAPSLVVRTSGVLSPLCDDSQPLEPETHG